MAEPVALIALVLDAGVGWPTALYRMIGHPVGWFAAIIRGCEARWNDPNRGFGYRRGAGVVALILLLVPAIGAPLAIAELLDRLPRGWSWLVTGLLAAPGLALRSLYEHVRDVAVALEANHLPDARHAVSLIVGRDTATLDEHGVARAAIESLAESFCDGIVAPLFWLMLGGLPALWAYKAVNTADSLIGHREDRWRAFGWASARLDDLLNLVPARLAAILLCIVAGRGWRTMRVDAHRHSSPNAGWPEAAMAGALNLALAGPVSYDGVAYEKSWIGSGSREATVRDIRHALGLYGRACLALFFIAGAFAWAR